MLVRRVRDGWGSGGNYVNDVTITQVDIADMPRQAYVFQATDFWGNVFFLWLAQPMAVTPVVNDDLFNCYFDSTQQQMGTDSADGVTRHTYSRVTCWQ